MRFIHKYSLYVKILLVVCIITAALFSGDTPAAAKKYTVAWSIYAGWMPWDYAGHSGILKKWADKYGIEIDLVRMDYIASIEAFVAKQVDACVMTNMEALDMPASSGIDTTIVIMGDYSNGNDAILTRDNTGIKKLPGNDVYLVELSVSHYLLARALDMNGLQESDVTLVNTSDSDIGPVFLSDESQQVVVTWNPIVMEIEEAPGIGKIFTSADIPGEILDMMVARTEVLKESPELGKALAGAWYEVMGVMSKQDAAADEALEVMAESAGTSLENYKKQLATTAMFYTPQAALEYTKSPEIREKMDFVRQFCYQHGLLGEGAESADVVGILYPDGSVQGDADNIDLRFDTTYMELAAEGKLAE